MANLICEVILFLAVGCSGKLSPEERAKQSNAELAKHRDAIQRQVSAIQALSKIALPASEGKLTSPGVKLVHPSAAKGSAGKNLAFVPVKDLADLASAVSTNQSIQWSDIGEPPQWLAGTAKV